MLAPQDRTVYSHALQAPHGLRLDCAVATTFSLDLEALLVLPFALATQRAEEPDTLLRDPVVLLETLRETSRRLAVFCQEGYTAVPPKKQLLYSLLEECVIPVRAPRPGGIFHPKLWLLRFIDEEEKPLLRAVVLSRNLTFDRSWDTVIALEGKPQGRERRASRDLADLVASLPDLARVPIDDERRGLVETLASEVRRTVFEAPEPFVGDAICHAIGLGAPFSPRVEGNAKRVLCVSPFLAAAAIDSARQLAPEPGERLLVSREDELNEIPPTTLSGWNVRVLGEAAESDETADADAEPISDDLARIAPPYGLHAKLLAVEHGRADVTWWLGSANLSEAAWSGANVELMVELSAKIRHAGIDAFLDAGFNQLTTEYVRSEPSPEMLARAQALDLADSARDAIACANFRLQCAEAGDAHDLTLIGRVALPAGTSAVAWPVTLGEDAHGHELHGDADLHWRAIAAESVTSLVAFTITAAYDGAKAKIRFALRLPYEGFPTDRHARIVRRIVDSRDGFFRYLRLLLAPNDDPLTGMHPLARGERNGDSMLGFLAGDEVLEDLLRTLSRAPERLDAVDRLMRDLCETGEGRALVPPDFLALWETITELRSGKMP